MYLAHFGSDENPFALTPDPRFLFVGQRQREALAHLLYGLGESGGFVLLTGEVGTGKTTLCRSVLEQAPEEVDVALILNPKQTALELVASVCDELRISYPNGTTSLKILTDLLNRHLLKTHAAGKRTALVIDEAQNLSPEVLEQVRLLTNLETTTQKLLQILLIGQPELQNLLARPELRQVDQRITARCHLLPLLSSENGAYIRHRLEVAGVRGQLFTRGALRLVHKRSTGVPRLINVICERALLGAYAQGRQRIDRPLVRRAAAEVMGRARGPRRRRLAWSAPAAVVLALAVAGWRFAPQPLLTYLGSAGGRNAVGGPPAHDASEEGEGSADATSPSIQPVDTPDPGLAKEPATAEPDDVAARQLHGDSQTDSAGGFVKLLETSEAATDGPTAFATLFRYWGLTYDDWLGSTACERAAAAGLRCFYGKGNWTSLERYAWPAVLELVDTGDRQQRVVAAALGDTQVTLDLGDEQIDVAKNEVEPYWLGDFIILWKPPPFGVSLLRQGTSGAEVLWLREQLDRVQGISPRAIGDAPSPLFDARLRQRVIDFQRSHALQPDGVVGEQTLIQLSAALADSPTPLLQRHAP